MLDIVDLSDLPSERFDAATAYGSRSCSGFELCGREINHKDTKSLRSTSRLRVFVVNLFRQYWQRRTDVKSFLWLIAIACAVSVRAQQPTANTAGVANEPRVGLTGQTTPHE